MEGTRITVNPVGQARYQHMHCVTVGMTYVAVHYYFLFMTTENNIFCGSEKEHNYIKKLLKEEVAQ